MRSRLTQSLGICLLFALNGGSTLDIKSGGIVSLE